MNQAQVDDGDWLGQERLHREMRFSPVYHSVALYSMVQRSMMLFLLGYVMVMLAVNIIVVVIMLAIKW